MLVSTQSVTVVVAPTMVFIILWLAQKVLQFYFHKRAHTLSALDYQRLSESMRSETEWGSGEARMSGESPCGLQSYARDHNNTSSLHHQL